MTDIMFPYGTFPLDDLFRTRYAMDYSKASFYPLPEVLPYHHPLFSRLEGRSALPDRPSPWWPDCVEQIGHPALRALLAPVSGQEFREGVIEASRWKQFRQKLSECDRETLPSSPKLAPMLECTDYASLFTWRGAKDTPALLDLLITACPLHALYMSNGPDWKSCQHFRTGEYNVCLVGNFYDTGVAAAMVLAPQANVWDSGAVLARTTLRVFVNEGHLCIGIGQTYHNNDTLAFLLLFQLAELLDRQQISWGFLSEINSFSYARNGYLGAELKQRSNCAESITLRSEPFWLPNGWATPYVDGGKHTWELVSPLSHRLQATLQLMPPRACAACAA